MKDLVQDKNSPLVAFGVIIYNKTKYLYLEKSEIL